VGKIMKKNVFVVFAVLFAFALLTGCSKDFNIPLVTQRTSNTDIKEVAGPVSFKIVLP